MKNAEAENFLEIVARTFQFSHPPYRGCEVEDSRAVGARGGGVEGSAGCVVAEGRM